MMKSSIPFNSPRLSFDWRYADERLVAGRQLLVDDGVRFIFDMGGSNERGRSRPVLHQN